MSLLPHAVSWLVVQDFVKHSTGCRELVARYEIARTFLYLLYLNPVGSAVGSSAVTRLLQIVNPLITLFVYAPYRTTLFGGTRDAYKKILKFIRSSKVGADMHT